MWSYIICDLFWHFNVLFRHLEIFQEGFMYMCVFPGSNGDNSCI